MFKTPKEAKIAIISQNAKNAPWKRTLQRHILCNTYQIIKKMREKAPIQGLIQTKNFYFPSVLGRKHPFQNEHIPQGGPNSISIEQDEKFESPRVNLPKIKHFSTCFSIRGVESNIFVLFSNFLTLFPQIPYFYSKSYFFFKCFLAVQL